MFVQAISKKNGSVMYQGKNNNETKKYLVDVYGDSCSYVIVNK